MIAQLAPCSCEQQQGAKQATTNLNNVVLATQTQASNQAGVTSNVFALQVIQQLTTLVNHTDQTTTRVVIFTVDFEVTLQFVDVGGLQCNLHFRRTSVTNSLLLFGDDLGFIFNAKCHDGLL